MPASRVTRYRPPRKKVSRRLPARLLPLSQHVVQDWSVADFSGTWFNSLDVAFVGTKVRLPIYSDYHVGVQFQNTHKAWYNGERVVAKFSRAPGNHLNAGAETWAAIRSQANDNYAFGWGWADTGGTYGQWYPYYNNGGGIQYPVLPAATMSINRAFYASFRTDPATGEFVWDYQWDTYVPGAWTEITRLSPPSGFWTPEVDIQFGSGYSGAGTAAADYAEVEWFNGVDTSGPQNLDGGGVALTLTQGGGTLTSVASLAGGGVALTITVGGATLAPGAVPVSGGGIPVSLGIGAGQVLPGVATISGGGVALTISVGGGSLANIVSILGGGVPVTINVGGGTLVPLAAILSGGGIPVSLGVGGGTLIAQGTPLAGGGVPVTINLGGGVLVPGVATLSGAGIPVLLNVGGGTVTPAVAGGTGGSKLLMGVGR